MPAVGASERFQLRAHELASLLDRRAQRGLPADR